MSPLLLAPWRAGSARPRDTVNAVADVVAASGRGLVAGEVGVRGGLETGRVVAGDGGEVIGGCLSSQEGDQEKEKHRTRGEGGGVSNVRVWIKI